MGVSRQCRKFSVSLLKDIKHAGHFNQILSHAIAAGLFTDPFVSSRLLLHSLSYSSDLTFSRTLFFRIQTPNVFACNFLLRAYSQSSLPEQCVAIYNQMRRHGHRYGLLPDNYTFPFVLKACARLSLLPKGQEIHSFTIKLGLEFDVFVQNALISMYCLCGMIKTARRVFDMIPHLIRDIVSWNAVVSGYLHCDRPCQALKVFGKSLGNPTFRPNDVTLVTAITACARIGFLDLGMKLHGLLIGSGYALDVFAGSALIDMYAKCGRTDNARRVFDRIPDRNVVCWTSLIAGYAQFDLNKEAIELFREMQIVGVAADAATVTCMVSACGRLGALDQGRWAHAYSERNGIEKNLHVQNSLIDMYSKCGDIQKALQMFHELTQRDVFSWTTIISGLAMNGESGKALDFFSQMEVSSDVKPNEITFLGVLSACSHGGFVDKGFSYLKSMNQIYNLTPGIEHYGCMVDLLGRANLLTEAEEFIRTLPVQPDVVIWRTMLFACCSHGNVELAEFAARRIEELEPRQCGARVLLSNIYASSSRWNDVKRLRKDMVVQGIHKQPGCSFVEVNGFIHEFLVADGSYCDMGVIHKIAARMNEHIQYRGFDSDIYNCE